MYSNDCVCVIAANNTSTTDGTLLDYIQLASIAADRVKYYLGLPTFILTTDASAVKQYLNFAGVLESKPKKITKRTVIAGNEHIHYEWINDVRIDAYKASKGLANRILMIDADYMVASNQLDCWIKADYPFAIFNNAIDISGSQVYNGKYFPSNDIVQRWATAMCWDYSEEAEVIFKTAEMVRDNYEFYAVMLGMPKSPFRNDVAFSVACHLHNVPVYQYQTLWNLLPAANVKFLKKREQMLVTVGDKSIMWNFDFHVINKQYAIDTSLMNELRLTNVPA
jgi:hypothetical protein